MRFLLYRTVKKYISRYDTVSVASLQRKFKIGYARAVKIMERLQKDEKIQYANGKWYVIRRAVPASQLRRRRPK